MLIILADESYITMSETSLTDPTLPLNDASLLHPPPPPPPLPSRSVRFVPQPGDHLPTGDQHQVVAGAPEQDSISWQVDGSVTNTSGSTFQVKIRMNS